MPELPALAKRVLAGEIPALLQGRDPSDQARYLEYWLRWSQSDSGKARLRWLFLDQKLGGRDSFVLALWKASEESYADLRRSFEANEGPWAFYQHHFFGWFLSRFDLPSARRIFPRTRLASSLNWTLLGLALMAAVAAWSQGWPGSFDVGLAAAGLLGTATVALLRATGLPIDLASQSLIPRLAAAVGIGYLFLASAAHLVRIVYESAWVESWSFPSAAGLTAAALVYTMVHIWRRVHPPLHWQALLIRSLGLLALSAFYSIVGLLLAAPLLFSPSFLALPAVSPQPHDLILCAAVALNLGMILQLAWDEKPLTEPL